jgi:hypothetical protein
MISTNNHWKRIDGFGGKYSISKLGLVRNDKSGRILKASPNMDGYLLVTLFEPGNKKTTYIHQLVASYFIGAAPNGMEVNHVDFDRQNNCWDNLEYVTPLQNVSHSLPNYERGSKRYNAKLKEGQIPIILKMRESLPIRQIASMFGVDKELVRRICNGSSWKHLSP